MPHGAAVSGDHEGAPGPDPQVRDQVADRPPLSACEERRAHRSRRPPLPETARLLGVAALLLAGAGCAATAPRYGTITFCDPRGGSGKGAMAPVTITYVSSPENEELSTPGARIHAKSLGWAEREEGIQPYAQTRNLRGPIFEEQGPVPLSPEQFADLWSALEETGILSIALSRAREPPRDRPYFLFEDARRRWIITRPNLAGIGDDSERAEDLARGLRAWQEAKTVIAIAGNAYGL